MLVFIKWFQAVVPQKQNFVNHIHKMYLKVKKVNLIEQLNCF